MKKLGFCVLAIIFFSLHLVSSTTEKALNLEQNDVKDKPLLEKLSSRNVRKHSGGGGLHGFHKGSGSDIVLNEKQNDGKLSSRVVIRPGGGGGVRSGGGRSSSGGGGSSKGMSRSPVIIPIMGGGGAVGSGDHHRNGSQNTGKATTLVMLYAWILLYGIHFFFYI